MDHRFLLACPLVLCMITSCAQRTDSPSGTEAESETLQHRISTNLVAVPTMAGGPEPVQVYAKALYGNKAQGTVAQGIVEVTSDLTRTFFKKKRFFAIHAVNRKLQALISQGHYRSIVSFEDDNVEPAGAALVLKGIPVADRPTARHVVQLYSHLYASPLISPDVITFAKLNLDPKEIIKMETVKKGLRVTAHFGSRAAVSRIVFLMSKDGSTIQESKEVFRSVYHR